jgi:hypothetical protein
MAEDLREVAELRGGAGRHTGGFGFVTPLTDRDERM